jgi:hypothetical protein
MILNTSLKVMRKLSRLNLSYVRVVPILPAITRTSSAFTVLSLGATTMFSDLATRVGVCYFGAIVVLAGALQFIG